ncbi:MAG: hypothetical protein WBW48_00320 [Anaerolineae bacterium]
MTDWYRERDQTILADALPDLVVGLMGIPVAFALQGLFGVVDDPNTRLTVGEIATRLLVHSHILRFAIYILCLYGLYSAVLIVLFEAGIRIAQNGEEWQSYLILMSAYQFPLAFVIVVTVIAMGQFCHLEDPAPSSQFGLISTFMWVLSVVPAIMVSRIRRQIWKSYKFTIAVYVFFMCFAYPLFILWFIEP